MHASPETEYSDKKDAILWSAYRQLSRFISSFEGVDDVKGEVLSMRKVRDEFFTDTIKVYVAHRLAIAAKAMANAELPGANS